jgi:hypothetical protein
MTDLERLEQCVKEYVADKMEEGPLKKRIEGNNLLIKQLMETLNKEKYVLDNGKKVVYSVTSKSITDEERLIAVIKKYVPTSKCIKTKEYIDGDVLEAEMYKDVDKQMFTDEALQEMGKCTTYKEVPTLNIRKAAKGETNDDND